MSRAHKAKQIMDALKKIAKPLPGQSLNELRVVFAIERAIARLESHPRLSEHLVFKGGFVLLKTLDTHRYTRDLDALALDISKSSLPGMVERALKLDLDDGVWIGDIQLEDLSQQGLYGGLQFDCAFQIGDPPKEPAKIKKLSRIHIDIGFGDQIGAKPKRQKLVPLIAENSPISWRVYPIEVIFSEKLQTLVSRGSANSRAKDIYDLGLIFPLCESRPKLASAIQTTFKARATPVPKSFLEEVEAIDLVQLRASWSSVQLEVQETFEECWDRLLKCLHKLDRAHT